MQSNRPEQDWYIAKTKPNCEFVAKRNLEQQAFATFLPLEEVTQVRRGQFTTRHRVLFPSYIFISFDPLQGLWRSINSTYGILNLVSFGEMPARVPSGLIDDLRAQWGSAVPAGKDPGFAPGDQVRVTKGPFAEMVAEIAALAPDQRVWILLDVMGGKRRIDMSDQDIRVIDRSR